MPFKLTIELSDRDLRHFRRELKRAGESVGIADDEEILGAAAEFIDKLRASELPDFLGRRLATMDTLLAMFADRDWPLEASERGEVLAALAYACDPEDIIPDEIPGIGLLDDAVMIELVFRDLCHVIEAYDDYRKFRASLTRRAKPGGAGAEAVAAKLMRRRDALIARAKRRRAAEK
jgi:uncharacterized membrane protein YkvA (DUF1232 family)